MTAFEPITSFSYEMMPFIQWGALSVLRTHASDAAASAVICATICALHAECGGVNWDTSKVGNPSQWRSSVLRYVLRTLSAGALTGTLVRYITLLSDGHLCYDTSFHWDACGVGSDGDEYFSKNTYIRIVAATIDRLFKYISSKLYKHI